MTEIGETHRDTFFLYQRENTNKERTYYKKSENPENS